MIFFGSTFHATVYIVLSFYLTHIQGFHNTARRAILLYPENFVLQLTCCITVPGTIPRRNFFLNMCVQGNWMAISNTSQLLPIEIASTAQRSHTTNYDFDKKSFYSVLQNYMNEHGLDGENCMLKAICETSAVPFDTSHQNNVLEKILHYIFTPSEDLTENDLIDIQNTYLGAELLGRNGTNCEKQYPKCRFPIMHFISHKILG